MPLPAASTTVMPFSTAALMAEKMSGQNCMATYLLFGPVACSSIRIASPLLNWLAALVIAAAVLNTPLTIAECTAPLA